MSEPHYEGMMAGGNQGRGFQPYAAVLACLIILPCVLLAGVADVPSAREGVVTDESGAPIADARVVIQSTQGSVLQELFTRTDGTFSVSGLPTGSYGSK